MATFTQLPSGHWRAQVRRRGVYKAATFPLKRDAMAWATQIEAGATSVAARGVVAPPSDATVADLIDTYRELVAKVPGRTKDATLTMLSREIGKVRLRDLSALVLREFIDRRAKQGAGGVTIAADLSFLSAVLKWGRFARNLDLPERLALDARASLKHRGLNTRGTERSREPTDEELARIYAHWGTKARQAIPMETICRFALATAMRQDEICRLRIEDIDREKKTVIIRDRKDPRAKAGNDQVVPLLPEAWAIVSRLLEGREPPGQLFEGVQAGSVSASFTRACSALGIEDLHFHDLRHRATADLFRMGLTIPQVALITGHKTWAMLRRYTDVKPADVHDALSQAQALKTRTSRKRTPKKPAGSVGALL